MAGHPWRLFFSSFGGRFSRNQWPRAIFCVVLKAPRHPWPSFGFLLLFNVMWIAKRIMLKKKCMLISMQLSFVGIDNASSTINFCHIIHIYATFLTRRMTSVRWTRSLVMSSWRDVSPHGKQVACVDWLETISIGFFEVNFQLKFPFLHLGFWCLPLIASLFL